MKQFVRRLRRADRQWKRMARADQLKVDHRRAEESRFGDSTAGTAPGYSIDAVRA